MRIATNRERPPSSPYKAYVEESRKPVACLLLSLPFLVLYHIGVEWVHKPSAMPWANGADVLIGRAMEWLGLGGPLVSLFVVITTFLFLQQASGRSWQVRPGTLVLMLLESLLFSLPPFLLGKVLAHVLLAAGGGPGVLAQLILSLGAGVYEEFLFRLLLMSGLFFVFRRVFRWTGARLYLGAVLLQAVLFAAFHHLPGSTDPFGLYPFAFRTVCGVYFAYLYQERGFGIAAGSHAVYDLIAVALNATLRG